MQTVNAVTTRAALRIAALYALVAAVWILLSDQLLNLLISDAATAQLLQTVKGWGFVAVTSALLFVERRQAEEALRRSHHQLRLLAARLAEVEESERRRLARELHDRVGQNLTALSINLNVVRGMLPAEASEKAAARLDDSLGLVEDTAERIRDVMAELRPAVLDDYGLAAALHWYADQFARRTEIATTAHTDDGPRLPSSVETALFRIVQEALTNVAKHAGASQVAITWESIGEDWRMTIADDGVGLNTDAASGPGRPAGWGTAIMRERAESIGGRLRVESSPAAGTRVIVDVPG
jgi:signal transduction histidine kinase